jgi:cytochrome c oxidase subunit 4
MTALPAPLVRPRVYVLVWLALLLLLALNWGLAQLNLGPSNLIAALAIAFVQMMLALLFFMHVRYSTSLTRVFVAAGFIWLLVLFDLTLSDYLTRGSVAGRYDKSWEHGAWPANQSVPPAR